jgi:N-acetylneuraminic acid mutarotase
MTTYKTTRKLMSLLALLLMSLIVGCGGGSGIIDMKEGRGDHAATLLPDGRLLVVGGRSSSIIGSTEVYDTSTAEWSSASAMTEARYGHTLTQLTDGKVFIVGGSQASTAEIYDPTNDTWISAGSMTYERGVGHTATLLEDGAVLVTGGPTLIEGTKRVAAFAEIYDPSDGTWSLTGNMMEKREGHRAVLLQDGSVLVVGGASAELYDHATGTWSTAGQFTKSHDELFTATLLNDGRVMVAGGGARKVRTLTTLAHVDIYDPSTGEWSSANEMTAKRWGHTATVLKDGKVLIVGLKSVDLYNPGTDTWTAVGDMPDGRGLAHTATLMENGTVFIVGGSDLTTDRNAFVTAREGMNTVDVYDAAVEW